MNSGDIFFNNDTLEIIFNNSLNIDHEKGFIFGQANIISPNNINWCFPGKRLKDIEKWLQFFEPNHQSMITSNYLAKKYDFPLHFDQIGDGYWKREIIKNANDIVYYS